MRVHLGSDHAGLELKQQLMHWLAERGDQPVDHGPFVYDAEDDYPVFCMRAARGAVGDPGSLGIVIGGSGNGEQIAANKVAGVRAALAWNEDTARLAREHNDANVISVGGRMHEVAEMLHLIDIFLSTPYSGDERHARRIAMLADYEATGEMPPLPESATGAAAEPAAGTTP